MLTPRAVAFATAATAYSVAIAGVSSIASCRSTTGPETFGFAGHPRGMLASPLTAPNGRPFGIAVSPAGVVYVTLQDLNSVTPINLASGQAGAQIAVGADPGDVAFDAAGTTAYVSDYNDGAVHAIDVASGTSGGMVHVAANAYRLALARTGQRLFVSSEDGNVYVVSTAGLTVTDTITLGGGLQGIALNANGTTLYVSSTRGVVWRIDAGTGAVQDSATVGGAPQDIALSPDGTVLYVANQAGWVDVLDAGSLAVQHEFTLPEAFGLRLTPDGTQLYVASPGSGTVTVLNAATGAVLTTFDVGGVPRRIAFGAGGAIAVISNENGQVDVVR